MKTKRLFYLTFTLLVMMLASCKEEEENIIGENPDLFSSIESVNFGDLVAGQTATASFYVLGADINDGLTLTVEGEGYIVSREKFRIVTDTSFVDITFAPEIDAALGDNPGNILLEAGGITSTIALSGVVLTPSVITAEEEVLAVGDVVVGSSKSKTIPVEGQYIPGAVDVTVAGDGFSVSPSSFAVGNGTNDLTVTYTAAAEATEGEVTGLVTFSFGDGLTSTLDVSANITLEAPEALPAGTVVYQNEFEFVGSPGDNDPFLVEDLEALPVTLYDGVSVSYDLVVAEGGEASSETTRAMDVSGISGSTAPEGEFPCSVTLKQLGTKVTISLTGLPQLVTDYTVTFWARPNSGSERELIVNFGGTEFIQNFNGAGGTFSATTFYKFEVVGSSDIDGNIVFDFGNNWDNTFRGIDFDHVIIEAGTN